MKIRTLSKVAASALLIGGLLNTGSIMAADKEQIRDPDSSECVADTDGDGVADNDCTALLGDQVPDKDQVRDPDSVDCTRDSDGDGTPDGDCPNLIGDQEPDQDRVKDQDKNQDKDQSGDGGEGQGKS